MRRNKFLAMLFGLAGVSKAQQWKQCSDKPGTTGYLTETVRVKCWAQYKKQELPLNNQCPVCGEMAPKRNPEYGIGTSATGNFPREAATAGNVSIEINHSIVIRCKYCNSAFWQDAEK
jgi:DNA-directed RNA polymerase subunit RPC12/RpoP